MSTKAIGLACIIIGILYSSLAFDIVYKHTLGYLVKQGWIKAPVSASGEEQGLLGPKSTIILYSIILIGIGIFMLLAPHS